VWCATLPSPTVPCPALHEWRHDDALSPCEGIYTVMDVSLTSLLRLALAPSGKKPLASSSPRRDSLSEMK